MSFHSLTLRPIPKEVKKDEKQNEDASSAYKKKLFLRKTLGWYYWLPSFVRPRRKLSKVVATIENKDENTMVAGATKSRNKMLLCEACADGRRGAAEALLDLAQLKLDEESEEGELPLCAAAANDRGKLIMELYEYRPNILKARSNDGLTALMVAAQKGQVDAAKALLRCGDLLPVHSAYDHITALDPNGLTARDYGVRKGSNGVVEAIDAAEIRTLHRPAKCRRNCGTKITFGTQKEHENKLCPIYTCACVLCGERVRRSYINVHQALECPNRIRIPSPR